MIVKNEATSLQRSLESIRGLVDEIVIADTGSTDGTAELAARFADRLLAFDWRDDFAAARNFVLEHATGEWVLSLDADETIAQRDHAQILAAVAKPALDAVESVQRHYMVDGRVVGWKTGAGGYDEGRPFNGYLDVACRRLFRRTPHLRWENPVHEELVSVDAARPLRVAMAPWVVHHFGKAGDPARLAAKAQMYLRIGARKADEKPGDALAQYELGIQYQELGRWFDALTAYHRAAKIEPGFRQTDLNIAICLAKVGNPQAALKSLESARRSTPQSMAEILLEEGNIHLALNDDVNAARAYRGAVSRRPSLAPALFNLALVELRAHHPAEALKLLDRTLKQAPGNKEARQLRATLRHDAGDLDGALDDIDQIASDPGAAILKARILLGRCDLDEASAALAASPDDRTAARRAIEGAIALARGRTREAQQILEGVWDEEPTVETALNLAAVYLAHGDKSRALESICEALRLDPTHEVALDRHRALIPVDGWPAGSATDRSGPLRVFFWHPNSTPYDGNTPRTTGLGGTESAVVYLAESLRQRGHDVAIFNNCPSRETIHGVRYEPWNELPLAAHRERPDVVVAVRRWQAIGRTRHAPLQLFWTGDAYDQPHLADLADEKGSDAIDLVVLQSRWQIDTVQETHDVKPWRILQTRLGYAPKPAGMTAAAPSSTRPLRMAYTSTPFRGLDVLLDLFPRIRERCPEAELKVFSSMRVYGVDEADDRAQFEALYRKAAQPGVELVGSVSQERLAEELAQCRLLAYPNHWAETFCIAAIEAEAHGCPVLTSSIGALPETVGDGGICIPGDPRSQPFQDAFVDAAVGLLTDEHAWSALSRTAADRTSSRFSWAAIAEDWETWFRRSLNNDAPELDRIARHLAAGRLQLASRMLENMARPIRVDEEAWRDVKDLVIRLTTHGDLPLALLRRLAQTVPAMRRTRAIERVQARSTQVTLEQAV